MVVAQIPLWIQHASDSTQTTSASTSTLPLKDSKSNAWTNTRRSAIYSIDIAGTRIATGGGDGMVRIWSMNALFATSKSANGEMKMAQYTNKGYSSSDTSDADVNSVSSKDESTAKIGSKKRQRNEFEEQGEINRLLCKLSSHSGSVLSLRFSTSHTILASAGDDSHVILYAQSATANIAHSGNLMDTSDNVENWNRIRICRGHNLDVVGLAWAPDDSHLISCSLDSDSPICVWRMDFDKHGHTPNASNTILQPYKILGVKEHTSTVKGVAFDPAGKYVASSGDDPSLCIWRAFDDWGLESRVDSSSGIFQQDVQSLANLSMFRRISFAPDGTHVCATNAMLRKKNIAAMVSRDGWGVSAKKNANVAGAANLVGHKQPVVSSRHCPYLFGKLEEENSNGENANKEDTDVEPEYSTLVALGDKKGFVTIWSTKKSRPIFKLQCSESRCTVTDMAWGLMPVSADSKPSLVMLISLLDGFTVALRFDTEKEVGPILSTEKKNTVFRLKYGIELSSLTGPGSTKRRLVDDSSGPKLIENVLQFEMEEKDEEMEEVEKGKSDEKKDSSGEVPQAAEPRVNTIIDVRKKQVESRSKSTGKKRIQPVLMSVNGGQVPSTSSQPVSGTSPKNIGEKNDTPTNALHSIERAAALAEGVSASAKLSHQSVNMNGNVTAAPPQSVGIQQQQQHQQQHGQRHQVLDNVGVMMQMAATSLPIANQKIYCVDLFTPQEASVLDSENFSAASNAKHKIVASCSNSIQSLPGGIGTTSCATISISSGSNITWRDHLVGAHCTCIDACSSLLALGSYDGTVYLYSTSPSLGWKSGLAFRSHPPFVMDGSIVRLSLKEGDKNKGSGDPSVEMLVLTSHGSFSVFTVLPVPKLQFKGTVMPAMNQMRLSASLRANQRNNDSAMFPELSRIVFTDSKHLLLILCHKSKSTPIGGLLQGFVYNRDMETWIRISDGRFIFSKFFSSIPTSIMQKGLLAKVDDAVRSSSRRSSSNRHGAVSIASAAEMYYINEDDKNSLQNFATKSHCEDRLACALTLQSKADFEHWLRLYVRALALDGDTAHLRLLVDLLLHKRVSNDGNDNINSETTCWWMSSAERVLDLDRLGAVEKIIIPEMTKNRSLQRLTNEFATEVRSLQD